ncbi:MAG: inner membrane protein YjfL [Pseudomonadota bacterium]|jgi:putative membrane protein
MQSYLIESIAALPAYLAFLAVMVVLVLAFARLYLWVTPYHEFDLIKAGNTAASLSFTGALGGFGLALHSVANGTTVLADLVMWSLVALVSQIVVFLFLTGLLRDLRKGIEENRVSYGVLLGGASLLTGLLNAGALSY